MIQKKDGVVIVVGAGLAGLSAAVELVEKGKQVVVLEDRKELGGRTSNWNQDGMEVESGLHRMLGFFEALPELLTKVGVKEDEIIAWTDEIEIRLPEGKPTAVFGLAPLNDPLKTVWTTLTNNDFVSPTQKLDLGKFLVKGFSKFKDDKDSLDRLTVDEMARKEGLDEETIHRVLVPLTEGLFFLPINRYSALNFFALFAPYLDKLHFSRAGAFLGGMSQVMIEPMADYLKKHGVEIKTKSTVRELLVKDNRITGVASDQGKFEAEQVILATALAPAQLLIRESIGESGFERMLKLKSMPSVTFQIELAEPAYEHDRVVFSPGTSLASYAEEGRTTFPRSPGRLSIILSEPEKYLEMSPEKILKVVLKDAKRLGLNVSKEKVLDYRKVAWKDDFYSYERGTYDLRPEQQTPVKGLYLAGDYTKQPYLQTMEGAVVSGKLAAEAVVKVS
jgi:15-cis-phytoene desaturase